MCTDALTSGILLQKELEKLRLLLSVTGTFYMYQSEKDSISVMWTGLSHRGNFSAIVEGLSRSQERGYQAGIAT